MVIIRLSKIGFLYGLGCVFIELTIIGNPAHGEKDNFRRRDTRHARRFEKGACIKPESINDMGRYHPTRPQRVDLLDHISQKSRNEKPPDKMGLHKPKHRKAPPLLLAGMSASVMF